MVDREPRLTIAVVKRNDSRPAPPTPTPDASVEYRSDPSILAQSYWYYVTCVGKARPPGGFVHRHRDQMRYLLHYLRRGEMSYALSNQKHVVTAGKVCLMYLQKPVRYETRRDQGAESWWFLLGGRDTPNIFLELEADEKPVFILPDPQRFERLFEELFVLTRDKPIAYQAKSSGLIALMLGELFEARGHRDETKIDTVTPLEKQSLLSEPVLRGIRCIMRFYELIEIDLDFIRQEATTLSLYHFVRMFHRETGMSPVRYLTRYRMEKAKELLFTTQHSIGEIARMVGIPSPNMFARTFRNTVGCTPTQFRKESTRAQS